MANLIPAITNTGDSNCGICLEGFGPGQERWTHEGGRHDPFHKNCLRGWISVGNTICPSGDGVEINPDGLRNRVQNVFHKYKPVVVNSVCAATLGMVGAIATYLGGPEELSAAAVGAGIVGAGEVLAGVERMVLRREVNAELSDLYAMMGRFQMAAHTGNGLKALSEFTGAALGQIVGRCARFVEEGVVRAPVIPERLRWACGKVSQLAFNAVRLVGATNMVGAMVARNERNEALIENVKKLTIQTNQVFSGLQNSILGSLSILNSAKGAASSAQAIEQQLIDERKSDSNAVLTGTSRGFLIGTVASLTRGVATTMFSYLKPFHKDRMNIGLGVSLGAMATIAVSATSPIMLPVLTGLFAGMVTLARR